MIGFVSVDRYNDYVVQLKTEQQKTHNKNNQFCECATINRKLNSVINGKCSPVSLCFLKHSSKSPGRRCDIARKFWVRVIPVLRHLRHVIRSRKLTKRQIIFQSANYLSFYKPDFFVKGQITALKNIFFMKLSCIIEVPLFDA